MYASRQMAKKILFATENPYKKIRFQSYFSQLNLRVLTPSDLGERFDVIEDGTTPGENAIKKAVAGYQLTGLPSFGVDYWFRIVGLPEDLQPGPFVRRIFTDVTGQRKEATDEEMVKYYGSLIKSLGGMAKGLWTSSIALVINPQKIYTEGFSRETILTSKKSPKMTPGEPLNSLQIDTETNKYFTDLTQEEWVMVQGNSEQMYIGFMKKHLQDLQV